MVNHNQNQIQILLIHFRKSVPEFLPGQRILNMSYRRDGDDDRQEQIRVKLSTRQRSGNSERPDQVQETVWYSSFIWDSQRLRYHNLATIDTDIFDLLK